MPTVLRADGFAFRVYFDDHKPAHVHAWKGGGWVVIRLPWREASARPLRISGLKDSEVVRAVRLVESHADMLWNEWRKIHDAPPLR